MFLNMLCFIFVFYKFVYKWLFFIFFIKLIFIFFIKQFILMLVGEISFYILKLVNERWLLMRLIF
ncbi:hypothetical protein DH17_04410 [Acinetobacter oleivorans]|uniref:Uncharacterized protein n=1 Tax=Acinetobacter oleivorans TaxID=1148157 RepID=A0A0B2UAJ5_9GAMM|nr:hypothetical protein DH17_04410 [Acinetobacter oleivorans]